MPWVQIPVLAYFFIRLNIGGPIRILFPWALEVICMDNQYNIIIFRFLTKRDGPENLFS